MDFKIWPTLVEANESFVGRDVNDVVVNVIDLRERLDQIDGVAFVTPKLRADRMRIDCDPQSVSPGCDRPDLVGAVESAPLSTCSFQQPKLALRHFDDHAYHAHGCEQPCHEVRADSRALLV